MDNKLLSRDEAYIAARNHADTKRYSEGVAEILDVVQSDIQDAINNGVSHCTSHFNYWRGKTERQKADAQTVVEILRQKGYDAGVEEYDKDIPLKSAKEILYLESSLHFKIDVDFEPSLWWKLKRRIKMLIS